MLQDLEQITSDINQILSSIVLLLVASTNARKNWNIFIIIEWYKQ